MRERGAWRVGPVVELSVRSTHECAWRLHPESGQLGGDLRQSLVDPGLLSDVFVEVNGVLQFVCDYGKVGINPMLDRACV